MTPRVAGADLPDWARAAVTRAHHAGGDVPLALGIAREVGARLPVPGRGGTGLRWQVLAALAQADLTVARVVEAHTDALAIRSEAGTSETDGRSWGVFAAETGGARLLAEPAGQAFRLSGRKPWCSLGDRLDAALITAWTGEQRQLFEVDLHDPGVTSQPSAEWVSRGLPAVTSVGLDLDDVPARPVGEPGWYLRRPGFAWGGMGVAACWFGGAQAVAEVLRRDRPAGRDDELADLHLGRADAVLHAAGCVIGAAADDVDAGRADGADGALLALRVRSIVADAAETVLREAAHGGGPAPLAFDERHAAHVADLGIYLRQHHGERDLAALGHAVRTPPR